ncbi:MAG: LysM peptidoglycan-binding domain-containing protein [Firmicutes bacterium]|nr:LysM peptidoglycan-binding domain-containing protein [Bacillota bacterium]
MGSPSYSGWARYTLGRMTLTNKLAALLVATAFLLESPVMQAHAATIVTPSTAPVADQNPSSGVWIVEPQDTLWKVAQITGAFIWALAQANHLTNVNDIHTGENLVIPLDTSASATPSQLPTTISLLTAAYPLQLYANGDSSTETLHLQVKDAAGYAIPNVQVALASSDRSVAYLQYSSRFNASAQESFSALTTDSNGMINVLATTSQQTGSTVLSVTADGG